jgi:Flp pilus assembly protein TadD
MILASIEHRHSGQVSAVLALSLLAACAAPGPQAPHTSETVSAVVKADVERAEDAEKARRHDVARTEYERAIADAHDAVSEHFARREFAETLETWGEVPAAIAQLERTTALRPGDAASWHDLGILYHHRGDDARALAALERAKQLAPRDPRPRIALGALLLCKQDLDAARSEYQGLLDLDLPDRLREKVRWVLDHLQAPPGCT